MTNSYHFDIPPQHKSIIKVIGVGGGGSNAVNHMYNQGIKDVEFVVCNTDAQALKTSPIPNKLQIGVNLTEGLGAGANPDVGMNAALESKEEIREMLSQNTKMVFITAGMGGGTGTGAAPVIAQVARELDILTVGIITSPFGFEGRKKTRAAEQGIKALKDSCDTVLVILNDKLREIFGNLPITKAFQQADNVLTTAAKGIAEIITVPGYVNVDFEDVKTVMKGSGAAVMGSAQTEGENRAIRAAEEAISSPLLNNRNIHGAQKILLSIISGDEAELRMDELTDITEYIQEVAGDDAEVIFGHGVDPDLGHMIRVTVIATGFETPSSQYSSDSESKRIIDLESNRQISLFDEHDYKKQGKENKSTLPHEAEEQKESEPAHKEGDDFPLDIELEYEFIDEEAQEAPEEIKNSSEEDEPPAPIRRNEPYINPNNPYKDKIKKLQQEALEREKILRNGKSHEFNFSNDLKERLETPAFIRKKKKLQEVPHSSEKNISRFNLNDDNQILGNNRFLHDNVD